MATSLGLAQPGEPVTPALLAERFDPAAPPRAPTTFGATGWP
jgi:glutamyl-tRNA synthetase